MKRSSLVLWSYEQEGSALVTALLMVSSYAPYLLCSVWAGALSDRWDKRRTMLVMVCLYFMHDRHLRAMQAEELRAA